MVSDWDFLDSRGLGNARNKDVDGSAGGGGRRGCSVPTTSLPSPQPRFPSAHPVPCRRRCLAVRSAPCSCSPNQGMGDLPCLAGPTYPLGNHGAMAGGLHPEEDGATSKPGGLLGIFVVFPILPVIWTKEMDLFRDKIHKTQPVTTTGEHNRVSACKL